MRFKVTREDIDSGICQDAEQCAIAKMLKRTLGVSHAYVEDACNIVVNRDQVLKVDDIRAVNRFIYTFDERRQDCNEFEFEGELEDKEPNNEPSW